MGTHAKNSRAVYEALKSLGFQEAFAQIVAGEMCTDYTSGRMVRYLRSARPTSMEEVADEMLLIREDRDRYQQRILSRW